MSLTVAQTITILSLFSLFLLVTPQKGFIINHRYYGGLLGYMVSFGDVNGDDIDDILVTAPEVNTTGYTNAGQCYVIFGSTTMQSLKQFNLSSLNGTNGFSINGTGDTYRLGYSGSISGDINSDGFDDIVLGAPNADKIGNSGNDGAAYVIYGNSSFSAEFDLGTLNGANGFYIYGKEKFNFFGRNCFLGDDINGDRISDMVIGTRNVTYGGDFVGQRYVIFGKKSPFANPFNLSELNGNTGFTVNIANELIATIRLPNALGKDVNGDGIGDLLLGSYNALSGGVETGQGYIIYGKNTSVSSFPSIIQAKNLTNGTGFIVSGLGDGDMLGYTVSLGGDVNGDNINDILITAHLANYIGQNDTGHVYIIFGKNTPPPFPLNFNLSSLNGSNGFCINGAANFDNLGYSGSIGGDVNGDSCSDILVCAIYADPNGVTDAGSCYVIFGRNLSSPFPSQMNVSSLDGLNGFTINGVAQNDRVGSTSIIGGDINGDKYDDILICSHNQAVDAVNDTGKCYLIFGTNAKEAPFRPIINLSELGDYIDVPITQETAVQFQTGNYFSFPINGSHFVSLGQPVVYSATLSSNSLPEWLTFSSTNFTFEGNSTQPGNYSIEVTARNVNGIIKVTLFLNISLTLSYSPSRSAPQSPSPSISPSKSQVPPGNISLPFKYFRVEMEQHFIFLFDENEFTSEFGQPNEYNATMNSLLLPSWVSFSPNELKIEGQSNTTGVFQFTIIATNENGTVISDFELNVVPIQRVFIINSESKQIFTHQVSDPSGGIFHFEAQMTKGQPLLSFLKFDSETLILSSTTIQIRPQTADVTIVGKDDDGNEQVRYDYSLVFVGETSSGSDINIGAIVGGVVGGVLFLVCVVIIVILIVFLVKKIHHRSMKDDFSRGKAILF